MNKLTRYLLIIVLFVLILTLFTPYYSNFSWEKVRNIDSVPVEDIGYELTFLGYQTILAFINIGFGITYFLIAISRLRFSFIIPLIVFGVLYLLSIIFQLIIFILPNGGPIGASPEIGLGISFIANTTLFSFALTSCLQSKKNIPNNSMDF